MKTYRNQTLLNVNADHFIECSTPEHAYLLGFIWADGTVLSAYKLKSIRVEITEADMNELKPIFESTGKWVYSRRERAGRQPQVSAQCDNAKLVDFLVDNDYQNKSVVSPDKILSLIPNHLIEFFIRGWSDGDGCFYHGKTSNQFTMAGTYDQDWSALSNLLENLGVRASIKRRVVNTHKSSYLRISNKIGIKKFGEFIYETHRTIGLSRKVEKYLTTQS